MAGHHPSRRTSTNVLTRRTRPAEGTHRLVREVRGAARPPSGNCIGEAVCRLCFVEAQLREGPWARTITLGNSLHSILRRSMTHVVTHVSSVVKLPGPPEVQRGEPPSPSGVGVIERRASWKSRTRARAYGRRCEGPGKRFYRVRPLRRLHLGQAGGGFQ